MKNIITAAITAIIALALAGCATDPQPVPGAPEVIRPPDWPATVTTMPDGKRVVTVSCDMVPRVIILLPPVAAEGKGP
ncbi:MAG: hypothetical protein L6R48_10925 [Planctomycetes bacterium]|nr:hypothetical protein [Planctomycetota bacterium]